MGGAGFEPAKAVPSDLQSDPFDRSGNPPSSMVQYLEIVAGISLSDQYLFALQDFPSARVGEIYILVRASGGT